MRWRVTEAGDPDDITTRSYISDDGRYSLDKEWYAQGPSLFSWMLYYGVKGDAHCEFIGEFRTKKAANRHVDALDSQHKPVVE